LFVFLPDLEVFTKLLLQIENLRYFG